jgi:hypothetical protein
MIAYLGIEVVILFVTWTDMSHLTAQDNNLPLETVVSFGFDTIKMRINIPEDPRLDDCFESGECLNYGLGVKGSLSRFGNEVSNRARRENNQITLSIKRALSSWGCSRSGRGASPLLLVSGS